MRYQIDVSHVKKIQGKLWNRIAETFNFRKGYGGPLPILGHYGGVFQCGSEQLVIHTDGVGTKVLVAQEIGKFDTVGIDAVAMSANDILCLGAETLVGVDYIALTNEDDELVDELMKGLVEGAREASCAIIGGETAIIPDIIKGGSRPFDLAFTAVGRIRKKTITGKDITDGDILIGLESSGLHSNGYTLARKLLDIEKWGKEMLEPTRIYCKPVLEMIDSGAEIHGIAHITGGAFSKITRLSKTVGFEFNGNEMPKPKPIFEELARGVKDIRELYRTFNMGIGMVLVVPRAAENQIRGIAKKHGVGAHVIGKAADGKGVRLTKDGKEFDLVL
ncbi:TPA: phosphoribosylformylglycinamidine cyclo-ligase [Candidatus Micrarchaeota archaeon]|nr:phosphoribosylformylglycinamidine cyclo-ligase [Candidatus Micrarchaeota archaeon]